MQYTILLDNNENTREIVAQEQAKFIKSVFEILQLPIDFNIEKNLSVNDKIQLRQKLAQYYISIIDDMDSGLKIFVEKDLVAEWKKPFFILKKDSSKLDRDNCLYLEMHINCSTIFDEENNEPKE